MSEEKTLTVRQNLTPETWQMITQIAPVMAGSRLFGVASPEAAAAIMLKGFELGLSLTASFEFIHVIDGKPGLSPRGALALIQQNENFDGLDIKDITDANGHPYACRVTMKRKNGFTYAAEFNMDDARRAGLVKNGSGWEKYPANMLRWRAVGYVSDVVFPDVLGGMKRVDELGASITPEGDAAKSFVIEAAPEQTPQKEEIPAYGLTLPKLMELAADADILAANGGAYPMDEITVNAVAHKLILAGKLVLPNENVSNSES